MKKPLSLLIPMLSCYLILLSASVHAEEPDWNGYSALLKAHVQSGEKHGIALNLVDYPALAADPRWPHLLAQLAGFDLEYLNSRQERLVFWINSYNILAMKTVLDHWPLQSIRDAGGLFSPVWNKPVGVVAGKMRSLHDIEHEILRPMGEPRIHFAMVCASVSCPDLRPEAYRVLQLDAQLTDQARIFLARPNKGLAVKDGSIRISKIFDWFEDDFSAQGGVISFIRQYRQDIGLTADHISYFDYDWSLNGAAS